MNSAKDDFLQSTDDIQRLLSNIFREYFTTTRRMIPKLPKIQFHGKTFVDLAVLTQELETIPAFAFGTQPSDFLGFLEKYGFVYRVVVLQANKTHDILFIHTSESTRNEDHLGIYIDAPDLEKPISDPLDLNKLSQRTYFRSSDEWLKKDVGKPLKRAEFDEVVLRYKSHYLWSNGWDDIGDGREIGYLIDVDLF